VRADRLDGVSILIASSLTDTLLNRALGVGLARPAAEPELDALIGTFRRAASPRFAIPLSPLALPATLAAWLRARGLVPAGGGPKLIRGAEPPPDATTDLRVRRIEPDEGAGFARVAVEGFGLPEGLGPWISALAGRPCWRLFAAHDGPEPVAVGALFVRDGVGWLGFDATLPSHRRRGAQGALIAGRIADASSLGCRTLVAETDESTDERPNPSYHNYRRMGFQVA
jgi:hypothetical protein